MLKLMSIRKYLLVYAIKLCLSKPMYVVGTYMFIWNYALTCMYSKELSQYLNIFPDAREPRQKILFIHKSSTMMHTNV